MFEHHESPVIPAPHFIRRMLKIFGAGLFFVFLSLLVGVFGYRYTENMAWIDAVLNAAMIAGGMGPVAPLETVGGKLFASFYAVYSGLFLIVITGFMLAPIFHRVMHKFYHAKKSTPPAE